VCVCVCVLRVCPSHARIHASRGMLKFSKLYSLLNLLREITTELTFAKYRLTQPPAARCCSVLQCVAVCSSVLHWAGFVRFRFSNDISLLI